MAVKTVFRISLIATVITILLRALQPGWNFFILVLGSILVPIVPFLLVYFVVLNKRWLKSGAPMQVRTQVFSLVTSLALVAVSVFTLEYDDSSGNIWMWMRIEDTTITSVISLLFWVCLVVYLVSYLLFYLAYRKSPVHKSKAQKSVTPTVDETAEQTNYTPAKGEPSADI